jgi:hypothetical protein
LNILFLEINYALIFVVDPKKLLKNARHQWLKTVILATWRKRVGKSQFQANRVQSLPDYISTNSSA